ncbi:MAG: hypothetical protein U0694_28475 [Anaerolineae bacterium]
MPEVRQQFGAQSGWDVVDMVQARYFNVQAKSAPRRRGDLLAANCCAGWHRRRSTPRPLFEAQALRLGHARQWLAARGMLRGQLNGVGQGYRCQLSVY